MGPCVGCPSIEGIFRNRIPSCMTRMYPFHALKEYLVWVWRMARMYEAPPTGGFGHAVNHPTMKGAISSDPWIQRN